MNEERQQNGGPWSRPLKLALIGFSLIGGFFLIAEHRAHVLPYLPWLLLAACPLMHLFGHGHGGHGGHGGERNADADRTPAGEPGAGKPPVDQSHHHGGDR
jgi:hypothetical protein